MYVVSRAGEISRTRSRSQRFCNLVLNLVLELLPSRRIRDESLQNWRKMDTILHMRKLLNLLAQVFTQMARRPRMARNTFKLDVGPWGHS